MIIFLLAIGGLMLGVGTIMMFSAIPFTSWDASWPELKSAFRVMVNNPRFQAGTACVVIGSLLLLFLLSLVTP